MDVEKLNVSALKVTTFPELPKSGKRTPFNPSKLISSKEEPTKGGGWLSVNQNMARGKRPFRAYFSA